MKFVKFCISDWSSSTRWLSATERGIYFDLLTAYYECESPLTERMIERITNVYTNEEKTYIQGILDEFFSFDSDKNVWRHSKCDEIIDEYYSKSEKARKSIKARWDRIKNESSSNEERNTNVSETNNERNTIKYQVLSINKKENIKRKRSTEIAKPDDVSEQVWNDFVTLRKQKKAPITETAINGFRKDAEKNGVSLEEVIAFAVKNGYQGSYYKKEQGATSAIPKAPDITNHVFDPEEIRRLGFDTV